MLIKAAFVPVRAASALSTIEYDVGQEEESVFVKYPYTDDQSQRSPLPAVNQNAISGFAVFAQVEGVRYMSAVEVKGNVGLNFGEIAGQVKSTV